MNAATGPSRVLLWFGVAGGPVAWGVQEMLGWFLATAPCTTHTWARHFGGQPTWLLGLVHLVLIAIGVAAFFAGMTGWRQARGHDPALVLLVDRYLGAVGMVISAVVVLAMIWGGLGTFMLAPCENMR